MKKLEIIINLNGEDFEKVPTDKIEIILNMVNTNRKVETEAKVKEESFK